MDIICSACVTLRGTVLFIAFSKSCIVMLLSSAKASNNPMITICSISDPPKPSVISARCSSDESSIRKSPITSGSVNLDSRCTLKICFLSLNVGRSMKNISSNLPLRIISEGNPLILLAVATTNTGFVFSCIQLRNVPNIRLLVPLSPPLFNPENPFSISSIQSIHGDIASAVFIASLILDSLFPTYMLNTFDISNLSSGRCHMELMDFAIRLFPQPGTPVNSTPFGDGNPYRFAELSHDLSRLCNHFFRFSSPPTSLMFTVESTYSSKSFFLIT